MCVLCGCGPMTLKTKDDTQKAKKKKKQHDNDKSQMGRKKKKENSKTTRDTKENVIRRELTTWSHELCPFHCKQTRRKEVNVSPIYNAKGEMMDDNRNLSTTFLDHFSISVGHQEKIYLYTQKAKE